MTLTFCPKYKDEIGRQLTAINDTEQPHLGLELRKLTRKQAVPTADFDAVASVEDITARQRYDAK